MPTRTFFELSDQKKARIMRTAYQLFGTTPYDKVSIQAIVEGAGIPRGSFYQYFTDKEDLYLYCIQENYKKAADVTYRKDMSYLLNTLTAPKDYQVSLSASWYQEMLKDIEASMPEEEFRFALKRPSAPPALMSAVYSNLSSILYPLLEQYIDALTGIESEQKKKYLLFLFGELDLLVYEYAKLHNITYEEATPVVQEMLRTIYESFSSLSSADTVRILESLSSIHFLSPAGLDLTTSFPKGSTWKWETNESQTTYQVPLSGNSVKGSFPVQADELFETSSEADSSLQLIVDDNRHCSFSIAINGRKFFFNQSFSAIGETFGNRHICISENGMFVL